MKTLRCIFVFMIVSATLCGQTIIMNEVSNGTNGNKEYVEFVVVDTSIVYDCNNTTPPCIDIRGWIFDDNSGYHGSSGIASGCMRFSNNAIWSCVPLGTIILIYNGADRGANIPPDDFSMSDGNCRIITPDNNTTLFEKNSTTPGASACSYPATGWTAGGSWNNTLLANAGDCARIVNLAGCEIFSLCWGSDNQNNLIYFSGSGSTKTWYFNSGNPYVQTNWSAGTAPANETPGAANNAANLAFINQFNNGCSAILPLTTSITSADAGCSCTGTVSVSASGSIAPYSYIWSNGETTASVNNLCAGTYSVTVTSAINCAETLTVNIASTGAAVTDAGSPQTLTCANTSVTLNGSCSLTGATFSWAGPGIVSGAATSSATVNLPGTYTLTAGTGGCTNTATVAVTQDTQIPDLTIANPASLTCINGNVILQASSNDPAVSFQWTGGPASANYTVSTAGIYSVQVTDNNNGCVSSGTVSVAQNNSQPDVNIAPHGDLNCTQTAVTLNGTSSVTNAQYQWLNGPATATYDVTTVGNYTLEVTDPLNGCTNTSTTSVLNTGALPDLTIASPQTLNCLVSQVTLSGSSSVANALYQWSGGPQNQNYTVASPGTYTLSVADPSNGCISTATVEVIENTAIPDLTIQTPQQITCINQNSTLTAASSITTISYIWSNGAMGSVTNTTSAGQYSVIATNTVNGCAATATVTVTENTVSPNISINPPAIITCANPEVSVSATSSVGGASYQWSNGNNSASVLINTAGIYTVTVSDPQNGCSNAATVQVIQSANFPDASFTSIKKEGCSPVCVSLVPAQSEVTGSLYSWSFSDGQTSASYNGDVCFTEVGIVNATLTVTNTEGCFSSTTVNEVAEVFSDPRADFTFNPENPTVYEPLVSFTDLSSDASSWLWTFDSITNSTLQNPSFSYSSEGVFEVTLIIEDINGCKDVITKSIAVEGEFAVYVPNAFTPNTDVFNPVWRPVGVGVDEGNYQMSIYDRWGMKLFETTDWQNGAWDGTFGGKPAPVDTYIYKIKVGPKSETSKEAVRYLSGHLNLIK